MCIRDSSYAFAAIFAKIKLNEVDPSLAATGMLTTSTIILTPIMFFYYSDEIYNLNFIIFVESDIF
mgnify:CR=1 FL=1